MKGKYFRKDTFFEGVNYWASHAGTAMWSDWRPDIVRADLEKLAQNGTKVLRVFPLWSDFQPITHLLGWGGKVHETSHGEKFLDASTPEGLAGVDPVCIERFAWFCDTAREFGFSLIVPLITGWMSGRCFFPPALSGRNVVTDPLCLRWELRFVKYFVNRFKDEPCIIAWELGNECNCLAEVSSKDEAYLWAAAICDAVKSVDATRPFISGMHGLMSDEWNLKDQAELCDILTIHPYPLFTPYCDMEGLVSPRCIQHSPAELTFYADIGGRDCLVEEIGSLGSIMGDEARVADFVRANLFNAWAYNGLGFLWWTVFDQTELTRAPYDWCDVERELGLYRADGSEKLAVEEYRKFAMLIEAIPSLPSRVRNAVCVVNEGDWASVFGSFLLAKRAGIELKYCSKDQAPDDAALYFIPGIKGAEFVPKRNLDRLLSKAAEGAVLVFSYDGGEISPFEGIMGCRSLGRKRVPPLTVTLDGESFTVGREYAIDLLPTTAKVVAYDAEGKPAITVNPYGKGQIMLVNAPLERYFVQTSGVTSDTVGFEKIYSYAGKLAGITPLIERSNPLTSFTVHPTEDGGALVILINNTDGVIDEQLRLNDAAVCEVVYGELDTDTLRATLSPADALIFKVKTEN